VQNKIFRKVFGLKKNTIWKWRILYKKFHIRHLGCSMNEVVKRWAKD
jgi:hypothetical protein